MNKIFGIGWAKTGTTTLGACFQILGYNHQGQELELVRDVEQADYPSSGPVRKILKYLRIS